MEGRTPEREAAQAAFALIISEFPDLTVVVDAEPLDTTDCSMLVEAQPGLDFELSANLQNDELFLEVGPFRCSWFPCTESEQARAFVAAVRGLLSGEFRIVETRRGRRAVSADLQRPAPDGWSTIARWALLWWFPWPRAHQVVVQNSVAA